jgi:hypothetical protein
MALNAIHPSDNRALPTLAEVVRDPACVALLQSADVAKLLAEVGAVQSVLTARLLTASANDASAPKPDAAAEDHWLTAAEGAALLRRKRSWLYRHWRHLPFVKRTGPRSPLLCSEQGIRRYLNRL